MAEQLESEQIAPKNPPPNTSDLSAFTEDAGIAADFVIECREHLAVIEEKLLLVERNSSDLDSINAVFRAIHNIKGLAGFLELHAIQEIAHEIETVLDHARARRLTITPSLVDALFEGIDSIRGQVDRVKAGLIGAAAQRADANDSLMKRLRNLSATAQPEIAQRIDAVPSLVEAEDQPSLALDPAPSAPAHELHPEDASLRIETAKLDHLMDMVGELVVAQTMISTNPHLTAIQDPRLEAGLTLLSRTTAEVQRVTKSMKLVPIGIQFQKTARLVRDLSRQLGKQLVMVTSGDETELDKTIAAALADPLMHMVRNSIDHGIEPVAERALTGKDPVAQVRLAAYPQSAQIVIEVSDDGRGLNRDRILAKAIEHGLVQPGAKPTEDQIFQFIFEPGISTAEKITGISGRGVGMDVVRRHVQKLRGRIDIQSEAGVGTTFFLRLPMSLSVMEGLTVAVGDSRCILPLYAVTEVFCPTESQLPRGGTLETVLLRGEQLPVVRLHRRLDIEPQYDSLADGILLVTELRGRRFCIFADEMLGKHEVVIRNLGELPKKTPGLMGSVILADGGIGLIVDLNGIMP